MNKRSIIVMTLVSVTISTIILLLSYFGIIRYVILHFLTLEKFTNAYNTLPKADDNSRVVISFTTTPERISKIKPMINSLLDQTVKVDQIALNIPYSCKGRKYNIPKEYKNILNIFRSEKDYGEGGKYIPTLLREGENNTKIIYLNDNQIYGKDLIETLVDESNLNPDKIIYTKNNMNASGGVLIKPMFFNCDVINRNNKEFSDTWLKNQNISGAKKISYQETFGITSF
jgi:hypothetical protein